MLTCVVELHFVHHHRWQYCVSIPMHAEDISIDSSLMRLLERTVCSHAPSFVHKHVTQEASF